MTTYPFPRGTMPFDVFFHGGEAALSKGRVAVLARIPGAIAGFMNGHDMLGKDIQRETLVANLA